MSLNVFIPTAGTGSRLGILTKNLNKSLITVGNKPIISHIIDNYPANTNFVIALGFKGEVVKQYLDLVYDKYFFKYVYVKNFTGPSSSLTHTLYCSQKHLYKNFIFHACDTIISKKKFITNKNWVGFADKNNLNDYRYIEIKKSKVLSFKEKGYN